MKSLVDAIIGAVEVCCAEPFSAPLLLSHPSRGAWIEGSK